MVAYLKSFLSFIKKQLHELVAADVKNYKISYAYSLFILFVAGIAKLEEAGNTVTLAILASAFIAMLATRQYVGYWFRERNGLS